MVRGRRGPDGKTPYELRFGKKWRAAMVRFGEHALCLPSGKRDSRLESGYRSGIYFGLDDVTGQHIVGTKDGWGLARSLRRVVPELQRNVEMFNEVRCAQWEAEPREGAEADKAHVAAGTKVPEGDLPAELSSRQWSRSYGISNVGATWS